MKKELVIALENELSPTEKPAPSPWQSNPYLKAATANNTRKAYRSDIRHFENWGGRLPATAEIIVNYLQAFAGSLNSRTLARRLIALKHWHRYQEFPDPTQHPVIAKTMSGITRIHGQAKEKAYPLDPKDLAQLVELLSRENTLAAFRDRALLLIGFFGAFRRSELVKIAVADLDWKEQGVEILIPQSKTDQTHEGQYCAIPYGKTLCPLSALKDWLEVANLKEGYLFREIKKGNKLMDKALSPLSVTQILKKRAQQAEIPYAAELSSHSLRRGFATSASLVGANIAAIMRQGRWKQVNTVMEYIEASQRFNDNAAAKILGEDY